MEDRKHQRLERASKTAEALAGSMSVDAIMEMGYCDRSDDQAVALLVAHDVEVADLDRRRLLEMARSIVRSGDLFPRWQALILVANDISKNPGDVWPFVEEFGDSSDDDLLTGVACVLLEHLLDEHFDFTYPKSEALARSGRTRFAKTIEMCWFEDDKEAQIKELLRRFWH